ncbi:phosphoribosylformylglycinamidine synthase subunit PurL [Aestuariibius insulae]|uniref:phosphoribosylformylglycinamidine synthase subunit PurL n=1 Tax=Aestuariibius insulae TaxID=2058287 RepID=UPI00345EB7A3
MREPEITPDLIEAHGLKPDEYDRLLQLLGRAPSFTELGIVSAMWNEHCSYKSSKKWLRTLPTEGPQVICGPGENAGVVDIGEGPDGQKMALVFKMESHNHPSYIEPYQGAATGVGGILRDVFTMGARPIAAMNALSFGEPSHPKTKSLVAGVTAGIGGYGNCFGVPTVGGECRFHAAYNGNCLVNAFAAGLADADKIFYSAASGVGRPVVYLGAKTGRDGVGGATMASAEFDDTIEEKRPTVQVGDPFTEKRLMEACLELMETGAVISIQDMGAAGLTCSAVEMGDKGNLGIRLDLEKVPTREPNMTAYEMMLSESQERMLMVLDPAKEAEAKAVFDKWDLDFAIVGETIAEDRFLIFHNGESKADLPLKALSGEAPEYDRPFKIPTTPDAEPPAAPNLDPIDALKRLISDPNHASKAWIYEQYDQTVMADTLRTPGQGAGIVRIHGIDKAIAFTSDVTPRYVRADPIEGGKQAVAEAYRNLSATGAMPLATTDNLNFGNPEKPEIMGQLVGAIQGIDEACKALDMPIVSGNVSLYNETDGQAILPTPTIGAVGLIDTPDQRIDGTLRDGHTLLLIGETTGHLGQSALLAALGREEGAPPPVDLEAEKRHGTFIRDNAELIRACTDLSDGGLALAAAEMAIAGGVGLTLEPEDIPTLFGEDQARYLVACNFDQAEALMIAAAKSDVPITPIGHAGGDSLRLGQSDAPLTEIQTLHRDSFAKALTI